MPASVLDGMRRDYAELLRAGSGSAEERRSEADLRYRRAIERYLDLGIGDCHLKEPEIARMTAEVLVDGHEGQYELDEWVIMPNHAHVILRPTAGHSLSVILQRLKGRTARQANLLLRRGGNAFWQKECYDHWIRSDEEKIRIRRYIRNNPVKAGLCQYPQEWPWCRAGWVAPT